MCPVPVPVRVPKQSPKKCRFPDPMLCPSLSLCFRCVCPAPHNFRMFQVCRSCAVHQQTTAKQHPTTTVPIQQEPNQRRPPGRMAEEFQFRDSQEQIKLRTGDVMGRRMNADECSMNAGDLMKMTFRHKFIICRQLVHLC